MHFMPVRKSNIDAKPAQISYRGPILVAYEDRKGESVLTKFGFQRRWFSDVFLLKDPRSPLRHDGEELQVLNLEAGASADDVWRLILKGVQETREVVIDAGRFPRPLDQTLFEKILSESRSWPREFDSCTYARYFRHRTRHESDEVQFLREGMPRELRESIDLAASSREPVLLLGDTGTGKTRLAAYIHRLSGRAGGFKQANVAGIPQDLFESELFGILEMVATGVAPRKGLIELADGGTLFLDEIGELSPGGQAKLLDLVRQDPGRIAFRPVGSGDDRSADVHLLAGTNRPIREALAAGRLRSDLFHRFSVVLQLPALADRIREDPGVLRGLFDAFLTEFQLHYLAAADRDLLFEPDKQACIDALCAHSWPGNLREFKTVCFDLFRHAFLADTEPSISPRSVSATLAFWKQFVSEEGPARGDTFAASPPTREARRLRDETARREVADLRRKAVLQAAEAGGFVPACGARIYGCHRNTFEKLMIAHGIRVRRGKARPKSKA
jgi:DNA-binding NtrC family response regulator